jgi:membrane protease YdiL (CAAX protease family)
MSQSVVIAIFVFCWAGAVVSWFFAAYHMFKASRRFNPERRFARYNPASFLMPSYFTAEGNFHRVKSLWASLAFVVFCGGLWLIGSTSTAS